MGQGKNTFGEGWQERTNAILSSYLVALKEKAVKDAQRRIDGHAVHRHGQKEIKADERNVNALTIQVCIQLGQTISHQIF